MWRLLTCVLAVAAISQPASAQSPPATFRSHSELVVLHVAVRDGQGGYVSGLSQESFRVSENRLPQRISFFNSQDAPVTVGLLIDASRSMAPHRDSVIAAAMAFTRAMSLQDEFFVLGFNERMHTPLSAEKPFTSHEPTLRVALAQAIAARGQTAIYDAVNEGLGYVRKGAFERQVLVVVSDGGDNASQSTKEHVLRNAQASNAVIYTIALVDPLDTEADPGFLSALSNATGGVAFRPRNTDEIELILQKVASDIRNMYTIGYVPAEVTETKARTKEPLRRIAVDVRLSTGQKLSVRTRRAYLAVDEEEHADAR